MPAKFAINLSMRLIQRHDAGGVWYIEFGRGRKKSLRTKDKAKAKELFRVTLEEISKGRVVALFGGSTKTLGDFRDEFVGWSQDAHPHATFRANRLALDHLITHAGRTIRLDSLTARHMDLLKAACRKRGLSEYSIDTYVRHIKSCLSKAVEWGYCKKNPVAAVKVKRRKKKLRPHLPPDKILDYLDSIQEPALRFAASLLCSTGRRRKELLTLKCKNVDLERKQYCVDESKTRESEGWHPMTAASLTVFQAMEAQGLLNGRYVLPRWHPDTLSHKIKLSLKAFGFPDVSLHGLRVSFGIFYLSKGGNLRGLQRLLGHAELSTTEEHYADFIDSVDREEADRVSFLFPVPKA